MAASEELGLKGLHSFHYFVHQAERSHEFYTQKFGWSEIARSNAQMQELTGQKSRVYQGGGVRVCVSTPITDTCRAARYLRRHPAGIGSLSFEVEDIDKTWEVLLAREATPIHKIRETKANGGLFRHFSITTGIGAVAFRFIEVNDWDGFAPGFEASEAESVVENDGFDFLGVDHITCNAPTMASVRLWLEHVMGMEEYWKIKFHTEDVKQGADSGTGLRSVVMWDPRSEIKMPINEPLLPFFKEGQINKFVEDNMGAGVQHIALGTTDVEKAVRTFRERSINFLETPGNYYDVSPERLAQLGVDVSKIEHKLDDLRELGILIDGSPTDNYLIQIFLKEAAVLYDEPDAGPFFYELIERCGDRGFGAGNFRALFEAIERDQIDEEEGI
jgi:4-hydroxyphenylpyruvate dioxygenase